MAKIELDESEVAALRRNTGFLDAALKNPETRDMILRAQKKINPDAAIPEIDAADRVLDKIKPVLDKVDALSKRLDDDAAKRTEEEGKARATASVSEGRRILSAAGYNAEGIEKIEKLMMENGIADYEAGMLKFEKHNPPPSPAEASTTRWGMVAESSPEGDDYKALWESQGMSDDWLNKSIAKSRAAFRQSH